MVMGTVAGDRDGYQPHAIGADLRSGRAGSGLRLSKWQVRELNPVGPGYEPEWLSEATCYIDPLAAHAPDWRIQDLSDALLFAGIDVAEERSVAGRRPDAGRDRGLGLPEELANVRVPAQVGVFAVVVLEDPLVDVRGVGPVDVGPVEGTAVAEHDREVYLTSMH